MRVDGHEWNKRLLKKCGRITEGNNHKLQGDENKFMVAMKICRRVLFGIRKTMYNRFCDRYLFLSQNGYGK